MAVAAVTCKARRLDADWDARVLRHAADRLPAARCLSAAWCALEHWGECLRGRHRDDVLHAAMVSGIALAMVLIWRGTLRRQTAIHGTFTDNAALVAPVVILRFVCCKE